MARLPHPNPSGHVHFLFWPRRKESDARLVTSNKNCRFSKPTNVESICVISGWEDSLLLAKCNSWLCMSCPFLLKSARLRITYKATCEEVHLEKKNLMPGHGTVRACDAAVPFCRVITAQLALSASFQPTKLLCLYIVQQANHENGNRRCRLLSSGTKAQRSREGENANVKTGIIIIT